MGKLPGLGPTAQLFDNSDVADPVLGAVFESYYPLLCRDAGLSPEADGSRLTVHLGRNRSVCRFHF